MQSINSIYEPMNGQKTIQNQMGEVNPQSTNKSPQPGGVRVRDYYERIFGEGSVGYDERTKGVMLNVGGRQFNLGNQGLSLGEDGRYYGQSEEFLRQLAFDKAGYVPVRNTLQSDGHSVGVGNNGQVIINGQLYNTDGMINVDDTLYAPREDLKRYTQSNSNYINKYEQKQMDWLSKLMNSKFRYDPGSDSSLQAAQKQSKRSAMRDLAQRGIINSSDAAHYTGLAAAQLVPQYEQMAYSRHQDENQRFANVLGMLSNMSENDIRIWKENNEQQHNKAYLTINQEQNALKQREVDLTEAWRRTEAQGYVSDIDAHILGVEAGTPAASVREEMLRQKNRIEMLKSELETEVNVLYEKFGLNEKAADAALERNVSEYRQRIGIDREFKGR